MGIFKKKSISARFIIQTTLLITFIMVISSLAIVSFQKRITTKYFENKYKTIQDQIAISTRYPLWNINDAEIKNIIKSFLKDSDILYIKIKNAFDDTYYYCKMPDTGYIKEIKDINKEFYSLDEIFTFEGMEKKEIFFDDVYVGESIIQFSNSFYLTQVQRVKLYVFIISIFLITFQILFIIVLVNRLISKPLNSAVYAAKGISTGEFNNILEKSNISEIDTLYKALNNMSSQLKGNFFKIESLNNDLEVRVEERTEELKETIETLKRTQKKLVQAEKNAALGNLVRGIAHELNTPVGIGVTATTHLRSATLEINNLFDKTELKRTDLKNYLELTKESSRILKKSLDNSAELVKSFKMIFCEYSDSDKKTFNLTVVINDLLKIYGFELKGVKVIFNSPKDIVINSFPDIFENIFKNFISNSLEHGFKNISNAEIYINIFIENNNLKIVYKDNGCGIPQEAIDHILEPFYTTNRGRGSTGLGLHIVFNSIDQTLGGDITYLNNNGLELKVTIPLSNLQ